MNKITLLLVVVMLLGVISLAGIPLRILFTNDTHATYQANQVPFGKDTYNLGGYANLERVVSEQKNHHRTLLFDSGDQHTGTAFSEYVYEGVNGGAISEVMNKLNYQAATLGNHEFDHTIPDLKGYIRLAKFPYVCANLIDKNGRCFTKPYEIITMDSLRVGVIGLIMTDLDQKIKTSNMQDLSVLPYREALNKYLDEVDAKSDLIVLLTHIGADQDSLLATQLDSRVDIILGGHSHTILPKPLVVNNILIGQTGDHLLFLGRLDLDVRDDKIATWKYHLVPIEDKPNPETELSRFVDQTVKTIDAGSSQVICELTTDWVPDKYNETAASRWQAMALYEKYLASQRVDFSVLNCGGLRARIPAGPVTMKNMQEMTPFGNTISFFSCTGSDLERMITLNLQLKKTQEHDIVQAYPLTWQTREVNGKTEVFDVRLQGEKVKPNKLYRGVSHDYVVTHADKYLDFEPLNVIQTNVLLLDDLVQYARQQMRVGDSQ